MEIYAFPFIALQVKAYFKGRKVDLMYKYQSVSKFLDF